MANIGVLHPGEMGGAIGATLTAVGHTTFWASEGRGASTARRAQAAGMVDLGTLAQLSVGCEFVLSVCPPHAALAVAEGVAGFNGIFVDANAIAPPTARAVERLVEAGGATFVDGGIVGRPPTTPGSTRIFLSGERASEVARLFEGSNVEAVVLTGSVTDASALKMSYAAWTKGTLALVLGVRALARAHGVEAALESEWERSVPDLPARSLLAAEQAAGKGWRWIGEMNEIASAMGSVGLPTGFHEAAADIYSRVSRADVPPVDPGILSHVLALILGAPDQDA